MMMIRHQYIYYKWMVSVSHGDNGFIQV